MTYKTGADEATGFRRVGGQIGQYNTTDSVAIGTPIVSPPSPVRLSVYGPVASNEVAVGVGGLVGDADSSSVVMAFASRSGAMLSGHTCSIYAAFPIRNVGDQAGSAMPCYHAISQSNGGSMNMVGLSIEREVGSSAFDSCIACAEQDFDITLSRSDSGNGYDLNLNGCDAYNIGHGGNINVRAGHASALGDGGSINFYPGNNVAIPSTPGSVTITTVDISAVHLKLFGANGHTTSFVRATNYATATMFEVFADGSVAVAGGTATDGAVKLATDAWIRAGAANKGMICCTGSSELMLGDSTATQTVTNVIATVDDSFVVRSQSFTALDVDWLSALIGHNTGNTFVGIRADTALNGENVNIMGATLVNGTLNHKRPTLNRTASYVINADGYESGHVFTNLGAGGTITFDLPHPTAGMTYTFCLLAGEVLNINLTGSDTLRIGSSVTSSGGNAAANTLGDSVTIVAVSTTVWVATSVIGTWTCT